MVRPTLRLVPLVFFRDVVVETADVDVVFRLSSYFRILLEMEKICVVLMERSQECESVILLPPLQFNEGFSDPYSFFHTTFKPVFLSVNDVTIIDINLMSTLKYVFEDC